MTFLSVLLAVLKILGIIVGSIIALILLLLLLILFVPIRYRMAGSFKEAVKLQARASYLLHLLSVRFVLEGKEQSLFVRIAGIPIKFGEKTASSKSKEKPEKGKRKAKEKKPEKKPEKKTEKKPEKNPEKSPKSDTEIKDDLKNDIPETDTPEKGVFKKFKDLYNKIRSGWNSFKNKVSHLKESVTGILEFIENEENKEAIREALSGLGRILKNILPRRYRLWVHLGLEDPATTGEITGAVYAASALLGLHIDFEPDFEEKVIEAEGTAAGHIRIIAILIVILKLYHNKKIKKIIHQITN